MTAASGEEKKGKYFLPRKPSLCCPVGDNEASQRCECLVLSLHLKQSTDAEKGQKPETNEQRNTQNDGNYLERPLGLERPLIGRGHVPNGRGSNQQHGHFPCFWPPSFAPFRSSRSVCWAQNEPLMNASCPLMPDWPFSFDWVTRQAET